MLENLHFTYNGISSRDMGVHLMHPENGGLYQESFLPNRRIIETKVSGRSNPFFQRVDTDPLSFSLAINLGGWKERNNLRQISRWLYQPYYKPLIFESNPDIVYYAMFVNNSELSHNGLQQGFVKLHVRLNSPYIYSIPHEDEFYFYTGYKKTFCNNGDLPLRLNMEITNRGNRGIHLINETNRIKFGVRNEFAIFDMLYGETIYVDGENEILVSSLEETENRYVQDLHRYEWIEIPPVSSATILFDGEADIKVKYQYTYLNIDTELIKGGVCW